MYDPYDLASGKKPPELTNEPIVNPPCWITHYACDERLAKFGGKTRGCCCVGHECQEAAEPAISITVPPTEHRIGDKIRLGSGKKPPEPISEEEALFGERFYKWFETHGATYVDTDMGVTRYEINLKTLMDAIFDLVHPQTPPESKTVDEELRHIVESAFGKLLSVTALLQPEGKTIKLPEKKWIDMIVNDALLRFHSYVEKREAALLAKLKQEQSK